MPSVTLLPFSVQDMGDESSPWSNPTVAALSTQDDNNSTTSLADLPLFNTNELRVLFLPSIPPGNLITGFSILHRSQGLGVDFNETLIQLQIAGLNSINKAINIVPNVFTDFNHGGVNDKWGYTDPDITLNKINSGINIRFKFQAADLGPSPRLSMDVASLTIHFATDPNFVFQTGLGSWWKKKLQQRRV